MARRRDGRRARAHHEPWGRLGHVGNEGRLMSEQLARPAFYASPRGAAGDWWTVLHPPYTAWHLSYVVIGAALAPTMDGSRLAASLIAFFAAVGVAAHQLDELHGPPPR